MSGSNNILLNTAIITVNTGGTWNANSAQEVVGYIAGGGNITNMSFAGTALNLALGTTGSGSNFSGVMSGTGSVVVSGTSPGGATSTQIFSGPNTYSGGTTISGGTLYITNTTGSGTGTGTVTVNSGGTFGGTGEATGAVTVNSGGTLSPGISSVGQLKINGNLVLNSGSTFSVQVSGASSDRLYDTGTVNLGSATLSVTVLLSPLPGQTYTILDNDGGDAITGTFSGLAEGATVTVGSGTFKISYIGGTGNDVTLTCVTPPSLDDYSQWSYSAPIVLNTTSTGANVNGNVTNFPVLVRINPGTFWGLANTKTGGADIRFAKTDGTHMAYQIDKWNDNSGNNDTAWIWVKVDTVFGNNNTQSFRMYWGNAAAADSSRGTAVFDTGNGFLGVWHLQDASNVTDATINNKTGTPTAVTNVPGIIGSASAFNGTTSTISIPVTALSHLTTSCTFSFWEYGDASQPLCASNFYGQDGSGNRVINAHVPCNCSPGCIFWDAGNSGATYDRIQQSVSTSSQIKGQWNLWTFVRGPAAGSMVIYYNGTQFKTGGSYTYGMTGITSFAIGSGIGTFYYFGYMDEFVAARTARSADWINLCYQNQQTNQTLVSILEDYSKWTYSRNIVINTASTGAGISTKQIGFPMLVRLTSSNFTFSQAQDSGQDVRFAKANGTHLPYQIDSWNRQNQSAAVWVNVDTVFGNNSSQYFTMYWGNSSASSASNGPAVFDTANNFLGAWHLNTAGTGGRPDATYFNDSARVKNGTSFTQGGNIGGCDTFVNASSQTDTVAGGCNLSGKSFTIMAWSKLAAASPTGNRYILGQGTGSPDSGLHFGYRYHDASTGQYTFAFFSDDLNQPSYTTPGTGWHFLAGTFDTSTRNRIFYLDGNQNCSNTATGKYWGVGPLRIGRGYTPGDFYDGKIDEVVVADTVRSADWIKLCYYTQAQNQTTVDAEDYTQWSYSKNLTLNTTASGANVAGSAANFPVLVRLSSGNFNFAQAQDAGQDIRFAKSNGAHLACDIQQWDRVNQAAAIWVKIDTVYGNNGSQYITMYWGNPAAVSTSNGDAVFDSANGFVGVWHLDEGGTGTRYNDASTNLYSGTTHNYTGIESGTALIGNGDSIGATDGHNRYIDVGSIPAPSAITLSGWVKLSSYANYSRIIGKEWNTKVSPWQSYTLETDASNPSKLELSLAISGAQQFAISNSTIPLNGWTYATGTYDGATLKTYLNGNPAGNVTAAGAIGSSTPLTTIGMNDSATAERLNGVLDEIRMEKVARDSNWIKLCYQNQQANQTLISYDDYSKWSYSKNININTSSTGANTTTSVARFPYLVRLNSGNFDFSQTQTSGQDIRFSKWDGTHYNYQIERWNNTGKLAEIWVQVDTIYGSNSSQYFKMYWGNTAATSNSNGPAVFDTGNGFVGVWHLNDTNVTTGYTDATYNQLSAAGSNMAATDTITAVIAKGQHFNGSNKVMSVASGVNLANSSLTVSAWANLASLGADAFICGTGKGAADSGLHFGYHYNSGADTFYTFRFYTDDLNESGKFKSTGSWHYIAGSFDTTTGSKKQYLYIDGSQNNSRTCNNFRGSGTFYIGALYNGTSGPWNGSLNEVRAEKTLRSADWINLCYYNQSTSPPATVSTLDSADAYRPLGIKRYTHTGATIDSIYVGTTTPADPNRWAIKFAVANGGGIKYLAADSSSSTSNQVSTTSGSANLFTIVYNGATSDAGTSPTLLLTDSEAVFARIRQQTTISSQPFTIDYTVLGSGKMGVRVTTYAASTLGTGLEFRIANNSAAHYRNIQFGQPASGCLGIMHVDSGSGKYDLLMSPFDPWTQADQVTVPSANAMGIKSSTWTLAAGSRQTWNFMIDFSHRSLHDSATALAYVNNYGNPDTMHFYSGTPLLEQAWESQLVGHWKLDEGQGATAGDNSGSGNNGNIRTTAVHWTNGQWGGGDSLTGVDSITVAPSTTFDGSNGAGYTILGWINPTVTLGTSSVIFKKYSNAGSGYSLTGAAGGQLLFTLGKSGTTTPLQGKTVMGPGKWYHVGAEFTWAKDTIKLYVNGVVDTMRVGSFSSYYGASADSEVMGKGYTGVLDDMRFYGQNLTDEQVKAIYLKGFSPNLNMYSARADNNSTVEANLNGLATNRYLPALQVNNYWGTGGSADVPQYVYIDGTQLTSGTDFVAGTDQSRHTLTIGFNRTINANSVIYISGTAPNSTTLTNGMPQMYWGQATVGTAPHVWVKNFSGNYFGTAAQNQFFFDWKMNSGANTKNGEMWFYSSSVVNPNAKLDTTANTNAIPGYLGHSESFGNLNFCMGGCPISSRDVDTAYSYSIAESSSVRVLLNVNTRKAKSGADSIRFDTRWAIYPTGQIWRWDSISYKSNNFTKVYTYDFMMDSMTGGVGTVTVPIPKSKLRAGLTSSTVHDFAVAMLPLKNSANTVTPGIYKQPFDKDTVHQSNFDSSGGVEFYDQTTNPNSKWGTLPTEIGAYLDIQRDPVTSGYIDSIGCAVQHFPNPAVAIVNGTLQKHTWGDLDTNGFSEGEGAYVIQANNNSAECTILASGTDSSCRVNPAFRITSYTAATVPQYVTVGGAVQTPGYGYNAYLNRTTQELILQLNQTICSNTDFYVSYSKTLAVTMADFSGSGGDRNDTLRWKTESEQQNLGFYLYRRIKPQFIDSLIAAVDSGAGDNAALCLHKGLVSLADTAWKQVNRQIVAGAARGVSTGPKDYAVVDYNVNNGIVYEYKLESVDFNNVRQAFDKYAEVKPLHIIPHAFDLAPNYPNPFRTLTVIRYAVPVKTKVTLSVYDLQGRLVRRLVNEARPEPGFYKTLWDAKDDAGRTVAAGPYVCRLQSSLFVKARMMILAR